MTISHHLLQSGAFNRLMAAILIRPSQAVTSPEYRDAAIAIRSVFFLGGFSAVEHFVDARLEKGLDEDEFVIDYHRRLLENINQAYEANAVKQPKPKRDNAQRIVERAKAERKAEVIKPAYVPPQGFVPSDERLTPTPARRLSLAERMQRGYEANLQRDVP